MAILTVPTTEYPTIQSAINAAVSGDQIQVKTGVYEENLSIIGKDNITIVGDPNTVIIDGTKIGGFGIDIEANNLTLTHLIFTKFISAISVVGNDNTFNVVSANNNARAGFIIEGSNNFLHSCRASSNGFGGILVGGNNNLFIGNRLENNYVAFTSLLGEFKNNLIIRNLFINNTQASIRINTTGADRTVIYDNVMAQSLYGIIAREGRFIIWKNVVSDINITGILLGTNQSAVLQNTVTTARSGIDVNANNCYVGYNIVQKGDITGITINGNKNKVIRNTVNGYGQVGLLVSGSYNCLKCNNLKNNTINFEETGCSNNIESENCDCGCINWVEFNKKYLANNDFRNIFELF